MLLVDAELVDKLTTTTTSSSDIEVKAIWGQTENLEELSKEARDTQSKITNFVDALCPEKKSRVSVRISHTLPPFGAFVQDPDKPWGKMAIRMLPLGAMGDMLNTPVLRLNRRADQALFDHYLTHLKYLFLRSKQVAGLWNSTSDFELGIPLDTISRIRTAADRTKGK